MLLLQHTQIPALGASERGYTVGGSGEGTPVGTKIAAGCPVGDAVGLRV